MKYHPAGFDINIVGALDILPPNRQRLDQHRTPNTERRTNMPSSHDLKQDELLKRLASKLASLTRKLSILHKDVAVLEGRLDRLVEPPEAPPAKAKKPARNRSRS
jgi:hypothetical protein